MDIEVKQLKKLAENGLIGAYKKQTYFVMAENNFIKNPNYTVNQKMVYLCLQTYAGAVESCYPSKESISKNLNLSIRTVRDVLKQLEELGALLVVNRITETNRKTSNLYILADIDKNTGKFISSSLDKFRCLKNTPLKIKGK